MYIALIAVAIAVTLLLLPTLVLIHSVQSSASLAKKSLLVVVTFPGIEYEIKTLLCDDDKVVVLTPAGVDPHNYQLKPGDVELVEEADLIITMGHTSVDLRIRSLVEQKALKGALIEVPRIDGIKIRINPVTGKPNLHGIIYDPMNLIRLLETVVDKASNIRPECGSIYKRNLELVILELEDLIKETTTIGMRVLAETSSIQYALEWMGVHVEYVLVEPELPLTPSKLSKAEQLIAEKSVDAVAVIDYNGVLSPAGKQLVEQARRHGLPVIRVPSLFSSGSLLDKLAYIKNQVSELPSKMP